MKTINVVAAVIRSGGRIFATQRGYGDYKDGWEFPGGKVEPGESPQEALAREIREELDTEIEVGRRIDRVEYDYPDFHLSMDCFWCTVRSGQLTLLEAEDSRWLSREDVFSVDWLPADRTLIGTILEQWESLSLRPDVYAYVKKKYKRCPEYLWKRYPDYAVFRHADNKKWFGLVMGVQREKLGLAEGGIVDILNVKLDDPTFRDVLLQQEGFFPGYHIARGNWISVLLDGTVPTAEVCSLIDAGYDATMPAARKQKTRPAKEWLVPANPKYYDIEHAFDHVNEITAGDGTGDAPEIFWKQGAGIRTGDTVFMYVAAPVSAILYRCKVLETDIPYRFDDGKLTMKALMKIRLERRYDPGTFTFDVLKEEYGIYAVRGPRGVPSALSAALKK